MNQLTSPGFSLIELLMTLAVLAIIATFAVPSFEEMINRGRVKSAAESIYSDLQLARQEALKRNLPASLVFQGSGNSWCYGIADASPGRGCDCTQPVDATNCQLGGGNTAFSRVVSSSDFANVALVTAANITYESTRAAATASGSTTVGSGNYQAQISVSALGSVSACTPNGQQSVGYPGC